MISIWEMHFGLVLGEGILAIATHRLNGHQTVERHFQYNTATGLLENLTVVRKEKRVHQ